MKLGTECDRYARPTDEDLLRGDLCNPDPEEEAPIGGLMDKRFVYTRAGETDIRKTFAAAREKLARQNHQLQEKKCK